jgi:NAD(P)-dependent dehydrogenase (short-subunit alcohol dehydrogenase family)
MKAAVVSLSQSLALELGPMNIRVNCIAPDFIVTPGLGGIGVKPPWTAIPREGHLDDAIGAAVWLAGPMSGFVTGTTIHIDGGKLAAGSHYSNESGEFFSI